MNESDEDIQQRWLDRLGLLTKAPSPHRRVNGIREAVGDPPNPSPEWLWQLALDQVGDVAPVDVRYWLERRAGLAKPSVHISAEDLPLARRAYRLALTDDERVSVIQDAAWLIELLDRGSREAIDWLVSRRLESQAHQARYVDRLLRFGYFGIEEFNLPAGAVTEYLQLVLPSLLHAQYLEDLPDFGSTGSPAAVLVHYGLLEGEDLRLAAEVRRGLSGKDWRRLVDFYESNLYPGRAHPLRSLGR